MRSLQTLHSPLLAVHRSAVCPPLKVNALPCSLHAALCANGREHADMLCFLNEHSRQDIKCERRQVLCRGQQSFLSNGHSAIYQTAASGSVQTALICEYIRLPGFSPTLCSASTHREFLRRRKQCGFKYPHPPHYWLLGRRRSKARLGVHGP